MLAFDTNLLFYAYAEGRREHPAAKTWIATLIDDPGVVVSELMLAEFYRLLRLPALSDHPKSAPAAVAIVQAYRAHPRWRIVGFPRDDQALHDELWRIAARPGFAYWRLYDARLALSLQTHGVTRFATRNVADFQDLGFREVFDPLAV
jgi:predicted nucleic acid-binding protein